MTRKPMTLNERSAVRRAILTCDQSRLDRIVFGLTLRGHRSELEKLMNDCLASSPHDVQMWWQGECNCDGHLN